MMEAIPLVIMLAGAAAAICLALCAIRDRLDQQNRILLRIAAALDPESDPDPAEGAERVAEFKEAAE